MLTDDDLTRDLRAAFHDTTEDLRYDGPVPAGPHTPVWARAGWVALPAAAAVAATVVVVGSASDDPAASPSAAPSSPFAPSTGTPPAGAPAEPALVTDEFEVMGMTLSRERGLSEPPTTISLFQPAAVPDGAREVTFPEMAPARAWVTTENGHGVLYLKAPTRNEGRLMGLTSPGLDEDDLVDLLKGVDTDE